MYTQGGEVDGACETDRLFEPGFRIADMRIGLRVGVAPPFAQVRTDHENAAGRFAAGRGSVGSIAFEATKFQSSVSQR